MANYNVYSLILSTIVFVGCVSVFGYMLRMVVKTHLKSLRAGLDDETIKTEYDKEQAKKESLALKITTQFFSWLVFALCLVIFAFAVYVNVQEDKYFDNIPTLKVVESSSMSKKHEKNTYLAENDLNQQFSMFDLLLLYKAPSEAELKKYDIIVYQSDDIYIIHRIIEIEEPNENHPDQRYFLCRGDANEYSDKFPVLYSQIKGIYRGDKIPAVGSFMFFLQSPAGWLCFALVVFATACMPFLNKKLINEKLLRLKAIGYIDDKGEIALPHTISAVATELAVTEDSDDFSVARKRATFMDKLDNADDKNKEYFSEIDNLFKSYKKVSARTSNACVSYRKGRELLGKITIHGKTVKLFLALDINEFNYNKYFQKDSSDKKAYEQVPFTVKVKSDRGLKNAKELIDALCQRKELVKSEKPFSELVIKGSKKRVSFSEKLKKTEPKNKEYFSELDNLFKSYKKVSARTSNACVSYRKGRELLGKITIHGKTVKLFLALDINQFNYNKYFQKDSSNKKAYEQVPFTVKVKSDRGLKNAKELVSNLCDSKELKKKV